MKKLTLWAVSVLLGSSANAAVFDFQDLTDTSNGEISGTWADGSAFALANSGERAFQEFDWIKDGITLTASATYTGSNTYGDSYSTAYSAGETLQAWAYLDQGNAGLGVCSKGLDSDRKGPNQCNPGSDDNVTVDEILNILFDQTVTIDFSQSVFRDGGHGDYTPPDPYIQVSVNGGDFDLLDVSSMMTGYSFDFLTNSDDEQFYIDALSVSSVPEPSVIALFAAGLFGAGFARRRQS
ncbi:MAG: PEP-CTERM sorting domain-containing protein [Gammaproteobacteria bacterium]|nr:PEP-CTERM sorting domain-containing protein [Gammaproteobacteria bacterium]